MFRLRALLLAAFAVLGSLALFVSRSDANPEIVRLIAPGVWFREGDLADLGHCNNTIIEMKDYLIVVDANFPSGARATMADLRRISPKPVKYVFDTHHHGDHLYGNILWTRSRRHHPRLSGRGGGVEAPRTRPLAGVGQDAPGRRRVEPARPRAAQTGHQRDHVRAQRRLAQSRIPPLRLGPHQGRRLRLPAQGAGPVHRRCRGRTDRTTTPWMPTSATGPPCWPPPASSKSRPSSPATAPPAAATSSPARPSS